MKIGIIIGHPTQFEGPFFRYAASTGPHRLRVIFTDSQRMAGAFDPELSAKISWGIDLLSGYEHVVLPRSGRWHWLREELEREQYDLLIINGYSRSEFVIAAVLARLSRTPIALRLDTVLFNNTSPGKRLFKRALFAVLKRLYQHFFAIGNLTVEYLRYLNVPAKRIAIFSYVVDNDYFKEKSRLSTESAHSLRQRYRIPENTFIILSVAKFQQRESPWDLIKAFCKLSRPDVCLLLVGDGEERPALEKYVSAFSEKQVRFAGYVPYPELPSYYGIADLFVHPAQNEPWGVSVQEALACGLPVIASSKVGAGHDLITPGKNGFVYQVGDVDDLHRKLHQMLEKLDPVAVGHENERLLAQWNYQTTWRTIVSVAERYASRANQ